MVSCITRLLTHNNGMVENCIFKKIEGRSRILLKTDVMRLLKYFYQTVFDISGTFTYFLDCTNNTCSCLFRFVQ